MKKEAQMPTQLPMEIAAISHVPQCECVSVFAKVEYKIQVVRYKLEQQLLGYDSCVYLSRR